MKKLILLLVLSLFSFNVTAQYGGYTMIGRWSCSTVLDGTEDEYNILAWWSHGFLAASGDSYHNDTDKEVAFTQQILDLCQLQPEISIYDATKAVFMWGGYE